MVSVEKIKLERLFDMVVSSKLGAQPGFPRRIFESLFQDIPQEPEQDNGSNDS